MAKKTSDYLGLSRLVMLALTRCLLNGKQHLMIITQTLSSSSTILWRH